MQGLPAPAWAATWAVYFLIMSSMNRERIAPGPIVSVVALAALEGVLIPLFVVLSDVPLFDRPGAMLLAALLGNLGIAAVGTLLSALAAGLRQGSGLLLVLVLPLAIPVVLAAAEATRLMLDGDLGPAWWRWIGLLGVFAVVFVTVGLLLFDQAIED